jgi:hypothetical protein
VIRTWSTVWVRGSGVDKNLAPVEDLPHLFAPRGFLDDTWWHRTYWLYGTAMEGGYPMAEGRIRPVAEFHDETG